MEKTTFTTLSENDLKQIISQCIKDELSTYFSSNKGAKSQLDMLSMKDLCEQMKVSKPTIIKWTRLGLLKAHRIGRRVLYKREEIEKSLADSHVTGARLTYLMKSWGNLNNNY